VSWCLWCSYSAVMPNVGDYIPLLKEAITQNRRVHS